jgi:hypothetical protein
MQMVEFKSSDSASDVSCDAKNFNILFNQSSYYAVMQVARQ